MTALLRYDAACRAIAEAKAVDEVKGLRDRAEAVRAYARQAKNRDLEVDAAEIRLRAERRLGEMLREQKETIGLNTGARGIGTAQKVRSHAVTALPTLAEVGIDKNLSSRAQKLAAVPEATFEGLVGEWREQAAADSDRVSVDLLRGRDKAAARAEREQELGERIAAANAELDGMAGRGARYGVIYADPEWRFEPWSAATGMDRAAENHYPTSPVETIKARPVAEIAARDSVLFLWARQDMLPQALDVMAAWGFAYVSGAVWAKPSVGTGYWFRFRHELLLVGTRGSPPCPAPGTQLASVFEAPRGRHSEKPDLVAEWIERTFPSLPKIELNARAARPGWATWGAEVGKFDAVPPMLEAAE